MKKIILLYAFLIIAISSEAQTKKENWSFSGETNITSASGTTELEFIDGFDNEETSITSKHKIITQDWYATTGRTRNSYGTNYSINVRFSGFQSYGGCISVSKVEVSSGEYWENVNATTVYGEDCTMSFYYNGRQYFFKTN